MREAGKYARFELERRFLVERLPTGLEAQELRKRRYHLGPYSFDVFEGPLAGLILAEVTFDSEAELRAHQIPDFAVRDLSEDVRYTDGPLAAATPDEAKALIA